MIQPRLSRTSRVTLTGLLAAGAVVLSFVESLVPLDGILPPGVKLGLANVFTMFAAAVGGFFSAIAVALFKAMFALVTRGAVAGLLSMCGGVLAAAATAIVLKIDCKPRLGFVGIGIVGALCSNLGQLIAVIVMTTPAAVWYAPVLILSAVAAGTATGLLLRAVYPYLVRLIYIANKTPSNKGDG